MPSDPQLKLKAVRVSPMIYRLFLERLPAQRALEGEDIVLHFQGVPVVIDPLVPNDEIVQEFEVCPPTPD